MDYKILDELMNLPLMPIETIENFKKFKTNHLNINVIIEDGNEIVSVSVKGFAETIDDYKSKNFDAKYEEQVVKYIKNLLNKIRIVYSSKNGVENNLNISELKFKKAEIIKIPTIFSVEHPETGEIIDLDDFQDVLKPTRLEISRPLVTYLKL